MPSAFTFIDNSVISKAVTLEVMSPEKEKPVL